MFPAISLSLYTCRKRSQGIGPNKNMTQYTFPRIKGGERACVFCVCNCEETPSVTTLRLLQTFVPRVKHVRLVCKRCPAEIKVPRYFLLKTKRHIVSTTRRHHSKHFSLSIHRSGTPPGIGLNIPTPWPTLSSQKGGFTSTPSSGNCVY